jgi:hypothetical protein
MYIKLFLILYADDTALMNESSDGLQKTLYCFEKYCDLWWKLTVNTTLVVVVFTVSFHKSQYFSKQYNVFCSPSEDSAIKAVSWYIYNFVRTFLKYEVLHLTI